MASLCRTKPPGVSRAHSTVTQLQSGMKYNIPQLLVLWYSPLKHLNLIMAKAEFYAAEHAPAVIFGFQNSGALGGGSACCQKHLCYKHRTDFSQTFLNIYLDAISSVEKKIHWNAYFCSLLQLCKY